MLKCSKGKWLVVCILGCLLSSFLFNDVLAAAPTVWIQNASDRAFRSSSMPAGAATSIALYSAKNEYEAAQIMVRSSVSLSNVYVTANTLTGPGGAIIPTSNIKVSREYNHANILKISGDIQNPPDGSSNYYDALVENTPITLAANVTQPYFYSVYTPTTQTPGTYTGTVIVNSSGGNATINVTVVVYNITLPATNQSTFKMNNWFTSTGWDYAGTVRAIPLQYNCQMFDNNWWTVITNIANDMAKHRNNVIFADFQGLLIPNTTIDSYGNYTFGWQTFDRFIQIFIDAGALQYIYTPHLLEAQPDGTTKMDMIKKVNGVVQRVLAVPNTTETNTYLDVLFPALKAHLDSKGWTNIFYMSALDEPSTQAHSDAANWLYNKYKTYFPNPKTCEAHNNLVTRHDANLATFCPLTDVYENNIGYYQNKRLSGKDLWIYTCIGPQGNYMNRFISYHLPKTRLIPWLIWKIGGNGYLHWGYNYWVVNSGGTWVAADTMNGAFDGDAWLVYPNKTAYSIYDSLRSEAQLDGTEDLELLNILKQNKPVLAKTIADTLIVNSISYNKSGTEISIRHKQILDEIVSSSGDVGLPFSDDFSAGNGNWVQTRGAWAISGTEYAQTDLSGWNFVSGVKGRSYKDFTLTFDVKIVGVNSSGGNTNWAGAMFRNLNSTDMDSGYLVALRNNGQVFLYRAGTTIATGTVPGYVANTYTKLKIVALDNNIKVFANNNNTPVINANDSAYSVGCLGLITGGSSARFDNVAINAGQNLAEGKTVTVSSTYTADGWYPQGAVDGQRSSVANYMGWTSNNNTNVNHTEWISIDLGKTYSVSRVDLYPRNDGSNTGLCFPIDFTIQISTDNLNWNTVVTKTGYPQPSNSVQAFPFAAVNARYIKITGTNLRVDPFNTYRMQFAEIQAFGGNLAAGRPVTASSSYENAVDGWMRANATDGMRLSNVYNSMGWSSYNSTSINHTEWVTVDLGGITPIGRVDLTPRNDGMMTGEYFPIDFTIQVSPDNSNWTTVVTRTGYSKPGSNAQSFTFATQNARYVKITGTNLRMYSGLYYMQFSEIEVYQGGGSTPPPSDMVIDNDMGTPGYTITGAWSTTATGGYNNGSYQYATAGTAKTAVWTPSLVAGTWRVSVIYRAGTNRASAAKFNVATASGTQAVYVNQTLNNLTWVTLGTWSMNAGGGTVTLDAAGSSGGTSPVVIADTVKFEYVSP